MVSPQALSEADRRLVAAWAADCAERVLPLFAAEAPDDDRAADAIARARAYARGELDSASQIKRRFEAGRAAASASSPAGRAALQAAAQASGVAHMGAHALGAAAYAVAAVEAAGGEGSAEVAWQLAHLDDAARRALAQLPPLGSDRSGPLGPGLLATGVRGRVIRELQAAIS